MSRRAAIVLALSLTGLSLTACATAGSAPTSVSEEGRWTGEGPEEITLRSGEVSGTDGCNGLSGTYTVNGGDVVVTLGLSTMMACFGVDTWLRGIVTATISDDTMTVFDRDGAQIGILTRAA